jgi:hypothetical protein
MAASEMIREALAATRWHFGDPPELGIITFIDKSKVNPVMVRGKKTWGHTWILAGFEADGETQGGLLAFRMRPQFIPEPSAPLGVTEKMKFTESALTA